MIDLVEEAIFAEELLAEAEPIAEPLLEEIAAAEEMPIADAASEDGAFEESAIVDAAAKGVASRQRSRRRQKWKRSRPRQ